MSPEPGKIGAGVGQTELISNEAVRGLLRFLTTTMANVKVSCNYSLDGFIWEPEEGTLHPVVCFNTPEHPHYALGGINFRDRYPVKLERHRRVEVNWNDGKDAKVYASTPSLLLQGKSLTGFTGAFIKLGEGIDPFSENHVADYIELVSSLIKQNKPTQPPRDEIQSISCQTQIVQKIHNALKKASGK